MDEDITAGEEMVRDLGLNPGAGVDDRQRFELLREWHREEAKKEDDTPGRDTHERDV